MKHVLVALALGLALPDAAQAFSDEERFLADAALGGGGGRFFTGSPADGFSCNVCHRGGEKPHVRIAGLPSVYQPGATYNLEIAWTQPEVRHGMELEFVLENKLAAGVIAIPEESALSNLERCGQLTTGPSAAFVQAQGGRQILSVDDCGASLVRFRWTAPVAGRVTFAGAVVRSDNSASSEGDGVTEFADVVLQQGTSEPPVSGSCSAVTRTRSSSLTTWFALFVGVWFTRRLRRG